MFLLILLLFILFGTMESTKIALHDLVLIGGGHSHVHVIKMFGMDPIEGVRMTVISKDVESPYSGMIPGYIAGYYTKEECHLDIGKLCSFARARHIVAEVQRVDTINKKIYCEDGRPPISYDTLSINIGCIPKPIDAIANTNADLASVTPVKPIDGFAARWNKILSRVLQLSEGKNMRIAIVGGGAGGVELSFSIHQRLKSELSKVGIDPSTVKMLLLNRGQSIMKSHGSNVRAIILRLLQEKGIEVHNNSDICDISFTDNSKYLVSKAGERFLYDEAIWCTEAMAQPWPRDSGFTCNEDGFISVKPSLETINVSGVFACGDVCNNVQHPRPKAGVFAVRAGPVLVQNLRKHIMKEFPLNDWEPQNQFLGIIGTGDGYAVASKGGVGIEGKYLWDLKDRIDRTWMQGYQLFPDVELMMKQKHIDYLKSLKQRSDSELELVELPQLAKNMGEETIKLLSKSKMRCGGCGSKVGSQILSRVLRRVKQSMYHSDEVISGPGDDAAVLSIPATAREIVQTVDYLKSFISDPFVFGQITANHALSDIFAMNAVPSHALALCLVPYGPELQMEESLTQMLAGMLHVLAKEECALVGGHTSESEEIALGLSVTGYVMNNQHTLKKGSPNAGDVILVTKAIGTGTILAADMRAKAKGKWVAGAISSMLQSNRKAANILHSFNATACTDVTGFGVVGHLLEMLQFDSNSVAAELYLNEVPVLEGAEDCIKSGILSTLHPENIRCSRAVEGIETLGKDNLKYPLLFDPQTSGGLLATVPAAEAASAIEALRKAGYGYTTLIGKVISTSQIAEGAFVVLK